MTALSPLELLHPAGRVQRILVLGEQCPPSLLPPAATRAAADVDLALIAPSPGELKQSRWLERAALDAARGLAEHGFAYALLPRRSRGVARARLREAGLVLQSPFVQLPSTGAPRYLLPLQAEPWRHALTHGIGARPRARRALLAAGALPFGRSTLGRALPAVGIAARPPGAEPLAAWVARLGEEARPTAHAVVATSWRGPQGATILYCFAPGEREPWGVAKVAHESSTEARHLHHLGDAARAAGARVPRVLATGRVAEVPALVETVVSGRRAADVVMRSPGRFTEIATAISYWLERWNQATAVSTTPDRGRLEHELLPPATELAGLLPDGAAYRNWLAARCGSVAGSALPLVAGHNDLTMWNVFLDEHDEIGVLDWAEAQESGLPLTDFFYAVADAAAACDGYRSRLDALRSCFLPGGARAEAVAPLQERLRASLHLTPEAFELSFHACWLHHARNEHRAGSDSDRPFLEIVRWLARRAVEEGA